MSYSYFIASYNSYLFVKYVPSVSTMCALHLHYIPYLAMRYVYSLSLYLSPIKFLL